MNRLLAAIISIGTLLCHKCEAQMFRFSPAVAFAAMNTVPHSNTSSITNNYTSYNLTAISSITPAYRTFTQYTTSVTINYLIPNTVFWDWNSFRQGALAALNDGPGDSNNPNYLPGDVPALTALAYNSYLNPSAFGQRTLVLDVRQWNGQLNWYSSSTGGGQFVKNWVVLFLPVDGQLNMIIK